VVYNPVKVEADELRAAIAADADAAQWGETLWFETTVEDPGPGQAKEAVEAGLHVARAAAVGNR
jgi:diacylglycerol kinase (ATP)